ncbi:EpsG family protein [Acinetobacter variabilis]|uniref:EpsG family protein n=1 Tax=Acinetobacter variabilis TaxID=70346 RepID=N9NZN9_9GAMM|nr:EpsG family protein [Acinetobacter variabilis]ENX10976.1 hypothetical protein F897_00660 [Acinetobacter variabilis]UBI29682.1 EpsG family protein [Acinetobacter variabilis]
MLPYMLIVFFSMIILLTNKLLSEKKINIVFFLILILSIFSAIRGINVGTDNFMYENIYQSFEVESFSDLKNSRFYSITEKGFIYICYIFNTIGLNYNFFLFFLNAFYLFLFDFFSKRTSINYELSWLVFIAFGYYTFIYNGLRQALAIMFCMLAFYFYKEKKVFLPSIIVLVASTIHTSCLVFLIVPFLIFSSTKTRILINILWTLFFAFGVSYIFNIAGGLNEKYEDYSDFKTENSGGGEVVFLLINFLFFLIYWIKNKGEEFTIYLNIFYLGFIVAFFSFLNGYSASGLMRLSKYFTWTLILMWPYIIHKFSKDSRVMAYLIFIVFSTIYFYISTIKYGGLYPYYLD